MDGACSTHRDRRGVYSVLVRKSEGKRPFGRPRLRWERNIQMDVPELGWGTWTGFIWLRLGTVSWYL
jgi:hypothetical protein